MCATKHFQFGRNLFGLSEPIWVAMKSKATSGKRSSKFHSSTCVILFNHLVRCYGIIWRSAYLYVNGQKYIPKLGDFEQTVTRSLRRKCSLFPCRLSQLPPGPALHCHGLLLVVHWTAHGRCSPNKNLSQEDVDLREWRTPKRERTSLKQIHVCKWNKLTQHTRCV